MKSFRTACKSSFAVSILSLVTLPALATSSTYFAVNLGTTIAQVGKNSTYTLYSGAFDQYVRNKTKYAGALVGVHAGRQFAPTKILRLTIGAGLEGVYGYRSSGQVWSNYGGLHEHIYNYEYNVNSLRLMLEGGAGLVFGRIEPFIRLGVGPALNQATNYRENAIYPYVKTGHFGRNFTLDFAYEYGGGINFKLNNHNQIGIMYSRTHVGKAKFDGRQLITYPYKLPVGNINSDDISCVFVHTF